MTALLEGVHTWASRLWLVLICAGGLGFVARDLLGASHPVVALAWIAGAALGAGTVVGGRRRGPPRPPSERRGPPGPPWERGGRPHPSSQRGGPPRSPSERHGRPRPPSERGQASVEWVGVVLLCSLSLGALASVGPSLDGRSFGGFLAHRFACSARGGCDDGGGALARAYGARGAALVRKHAPNLVYERGERQLPVDWRSCRRPQCASAPDEPDLDVHRSDTGERATVFTRLLRRGGRTYIQYWLYYPDSNTTFAGADKAWEASWLLPRIKRLVTGSGDWFGYHRDDWESVHVRLDPDGSTWVRASSHGHYQGCNEKECRNRWTRAGGWARVSRGSHAGHIPMRKEDGRRTPAYPGPDLHERTTTAEGLRLIPLETHDRRRYRRHDERVAPPWRKDAYHDPRSGES
jgi:hypothetical protein